MSQTIKPAATTTWVIPRIDHDVVAAAIKRGRHQRNEAIWAAVRSAMGFVTGHRFATATREPNGALAH